MTLRIDGLEQLQKQIDELTKKAEELDGSHSVPIAELLTPDFLADCSVFASVDEMFEASGFKVESPEDFEAIPDEEWEWFIQQNTSYTSWSEMTEAAGVIWAKNKMGFEE